MEGEPVHAGLHWGEDGRGERGDGKVFQKRPAMEPTRLT